MLHDTPARYGAISKFLHWSMALLFLWQLLKLGDRINDGEHWIGQTLVPFHGSIGLILLVMIVLRIVWSLKQRNQRPPYEPATRSEEHTSELQSRENLVCRLLLEKKNTN